MFASCKAVSKRDSPMHGLFIGLGKLKQVQKSNYVSKVFSSDGKCDREIQRHIRTAKDALQKLNTVLKERKI